MSTSYAQLDDTESTEINIQSDISLVEPIDDFTVPFINKIGYAHGHIMNDLCAGVWFTYLLIFLTRVPGLTQGEAGGVMLAGQIADAIFTPIAGVLVDSSSGYKHLNIGPKKMWNFIGTVLVAGSFFCMLSYCIPCNWGTGVKDTTSLTIYYSIAAGLFNVGWAIAQVSHMALVPSLSYCKIQRVQLNSYRYIGTILSNVAVLLLFLLYQQMFNGDFTTLFRDLGYSVLSIGGLACIIFLILTPESFCPPECPESLANNISSPIVGGQPDSEDRLRVAAQASSATVPLLRRSSTTGSILLPTDTSRMAWFYVLDFWKVGLNYMCTRLAVNFAQVYLPIYLLQTLDVGNDSPLVAIVPLLVYISSLLVSPFQKTLTVRFGLSRLYIFGSLIVMGACALIYITNKGDHQMVFLTAFCLGIGTTIISIVSVSYEADLVGSSCKTSAFVYGIMSLTDKLSNGIAIFVTQQLIQHYFGGGDVQSDAYGLFVRYILTFIPVISCILACLFTLNVHGYGHQKVDNKPSQINEAGSDIIVN